MAEGRFRQDLYYRVNVINIELPPLRERISDIPLLAKHFLEEVCEESGSKVHGFSDDALVALQRYRWPGNVRELQNVVERAVLLGKSERCSGRRLAAATRRRSAAFGPFRSRHAILKQAMEAPEKQIILDVLERTTGTARPRPKRWASTARRSTRR